MVNIDEVCRDGEPKYWAGIFFDNAAITLLSGDFREFPNFPKFTAYNVYHPEDFTKMENDSSLPDSIKSNLRTLRDHEPSRDPEFTSPSLEGQHVLRTPTASAGEQLRDVLTPIQMALDSQFYSKSRQELGTIRDSLGMEEVYQI